MTYFESHKDDSPQAIGTHEGSDSAAALFDKDADFRILTLGVVCYNTTQNSHGLITAVTEHTLTATDVTWDKDDTYEVYITETKDKFISRVAIGKIYGHRLKHGEIEPDGDTEFSNN